MHDARAEGGVAPTALARDRERVGQAQVADHMTAPVVTASPNWDVGVAAAEMHDRRIRHLVVLDQGAAAGVLSVRDVMSVFLPERVHRQEA